MLRLVTAAMNIIWSEIGSTELHGIGREKIYQVGKTDYQLVEMTQIQLSEYNKLKETYSLYNETCDKINLGNLIMLLNRIFPNRGEASIVAYKKVLDDLINCGYTRINQIESIIVDVSPVYSIYKDEQENDPLPDVGALRVSMEIYDSKFREKSHIAKNVIKYSDILLEIVGRS
jgi:hypothetical protein